MFYAFKSDTSSRRFALSQSKKFVVDLDALWHLLISRHRSAASATCRLPHCGPRPNPAESGKRRLCLLFVLIVTLRRAAD